MSFFQKLLRKLVSPVARKSAPVTCKPTLETLEDRSLPAALGFHFVLNDPTNQFAAYPQLQSNLNAAGQILAGILGGQGNIEVSVRPDNTIPRAEATTVGVVPVSTVGGVTVYENAAVSAAQTGVDPNGPGAPEIELDINTQSYLPQAWFDPSGAARTAQVPAGQTDFISVVTHELLHGCGFTGYRTVGGANDGQLPAGYESAYDALTRFGAGGDPNVLYFVGPTAMAVYGGPVPLTSQGPSGFLTSQNYYHVGNPTGQAGSNLTGNIMNGVVFSYGTRYALDTLDAAMLQDLGWTVHMAGVPSLSTTAASAASATAANGQDLTGQVQVRFGRVRAGKGQQHSRKVVLQNISGQTLQGALTLLVYGSPGRTGLQRKGGRFSGKPAVAKVINAGPIAPGASVTVTINWGSAKGGHPTARVVAIGG